MAEGLHAVISADTKDFELALGRSKRSSTELAAALKHAGTQAGAFKPLAANAVVGLQGMKTAADGAKRSFGLAKNSTQQLGYQIQDISVQLQSGTSAFTVFAQQGSQIASIFGPGGAVIGAVIAVSAAIGGTLFNSLRGVKEETKDWREEVDSLVGSLRHLSLMELNDQAFDTQQTIESLTDRAKRLKEQMNIEWEEGNLKTVESLSKEYDDINEKLRRYELTLINIGQAQDNLFKGDPLSGDKADPNKEDPIMTLQQQLQQRIAIIRQFDALEAETLAAKLALQKEQIALALENESITKQEARDYQLAAEDQYQQSLTAIAERETKRRMQLDDEAAAQNLHNLKQRQATTSQILSNITSLMGTNSRKMFEIGKAAGISNAIVSTYTGAAKALELGWPLGPIAAAAITASGIAKVQAISSQSFGGGGAAPASGGSGILSGAVPQQQAQQQQPQNQIVSINLEGEVFGREQVRGLIGQINDALEDGYTLRV